MAGRLVGQLARRFGRRRSASIQPDSAPLRAISACLAGRDDVIGWALAAHPPSEQCSTTNPLSHAVLAAFDTGHRLHGDPNSLAWSIPRNLSRPFVVAVGANTVSMWSTESKDVVRLALFNLEQVQSITPTQHIDQDTTYYELRFVDRSSIVIAVTSSFRFDAALREFGVHRPNQVRDR